MNADNSMEYEQYLNGTISFEEYLKTLKSDDPKDSANLFALKMNSLGYLLNFSVKSLSEEIDKILDNEIRLDWALEEKIKFESSLTAYIGETLCQIYDGKWQGAFFANAGNYYTSYILFGDYRLCPSHFIEYRISNGKEEEGTFGGYFEIVQPELISRKSNFNK